MRVTGACAKLAGGPPGVAEAVARELRQKREECTTVQDALDAWVAEYEAAVDELVQVVREQRRKWGEGSRTSEQRPRLEQRIDRLRQRWNVVDAFLE